MAVLIGSARSDEKGKITGGKAGDQNGGKEVSTQNWYRHKHGWRTFRCKDPNKAAKMAAAMRWLCGSDLVGYDQWQRNDLYEKLEALRWNYTRLKTKTETDCSALIRVCAACAGIFLPDFNTGNQAGVLLASGEFVELKGGKYNDRDDFLGAGDVQVSRVKGHTVMALTDGAKFESGAAEKEPVPGADVLNTDTPKCEAVAFVQEMLIGLGYDLGKYGADGEFGDCTELAVMQFQRDHGLETDGEYGPITHGALLKALEESDKPNTGKVVRIEGGQCWARGEPDPEGMKLGVAACGSRWPFLGEVADGWLKIDFGGAAGWVSGKYGKAV